MRIFLSTHINKLDKKGRVSVPAQFRQVLTAQAETGIVLFRSNHHPALEGFTPQRIEEISQNLDHFDLFSPQQDDLAVAIFADAVSLPLDGDGRVVLPPLLISHCGLTDKVAFVGLGKKFQIWNPDQLDARMKTAKQTVSDQKLTIPTHTPTTGGGK